MSTDAVAKPLVADFSQSRNDLYWKVYAGEDGFIRWTGYDDNYWWSNIATSERRQTRVGPKTGRVFVLNPATNAVEIRTALSEPRHD